MPTNGTHGTTRAETGHSTSQPRRTVTIFHLARMRRPALQGLYLQVCAPSDGAAAAAAALMTREQLAAAIWAARRAGAA